MAAVSFVPDLAGETMARRRVETDRLRELVRLHRMGSSWRGVARLLRMGPNTVSRYRAVLAHAGLLAGPLDVLPTLEAVRSAVVAAFPAQDVPRPAPPSWHERLVALVGNGLAARAAFDRLRLEATPERPFLASYSAIKRAVRQLKRAQGVQPEDVVVPVAPCRPGEVAQVDLGYAGRFYDPATGTLRRAWVFVAVLVHSKYMFVQLVFDQKIETWLRLHQQALAFFGGSVETVIPDNSKRAVLRMAFGIDGPTELNRSYPELASKYGFKVDPTPPGSPWNKGQVEAAVRYVLHNGLAARDGQAIDDAQAALHRWNREIASTRVHGTTRRRPVDVFEQEERSALRPLPADAGDLVVWKRARVHPDGHVAYRERLYSVPWTLVHEDVWVRAGRAVEVFHHDALVATHPRQGPRRSTLEEHLPPERRDWRHRGRAFWEERAAGIGPETVAYVREVFDHDDVLSHLRQVQAIVRLLETFPRSRAEAAAARARRGADHSYHGVRRILALALDLQPAALPPPSSAAHATAMGA